MYQVSFLILYDTTHPLREQLFFCLIKKVFPSLTELHGLILPENPAFEMGGVWGRGADKTGRTLPSHACSLGVGLAAWVFNMKSKDSEVEILVDIKAGIFLNYQQCCLMAPSISPVHLSQILFEFNPGDGKVQHIVTSWVFTETSFQFLFLTVNFWGLLASSAVSPVSHLKIPFFLLASYLPYYSV